MHEVETAALHPLADSTRGNANLGKLPKRHQTMLRLGNPRDSPVARRRRAETVSLCHV